MNPLKLTDEQLSIILSCAALMGTVWGDDEGHRKPLLTAERLLDYFGLDWYNVTPDQVLRELERRGMA